MKVFLSYRRVDTGGEVGRFADMLRARMRPTNIFFDIDSIEAGANFETAILSAVRECDYFLAFIGPNWLSSDASGKRRIDDIDDYVRRELATALECGRMIIPVVVNNAVPPDSGTLPSDIRGLSKRQGTPLRHASFREDAEALLERILPSARPQPHESLEFCIGALTDKRTHTAVPGGGVLHQFRDDDLLPPMVLVPQGQFQMAGRQIRVPRAFAIGQAPVSVHEFGVFVNATNHQYAGDVYIWSDTHWLESASESFRDPGFKQHATHPVVCVNWHDAEAYLRWASEITGEIYRLCTEAEWEYAARAGCQELVWWVDGRGADFAHFQSDRSDRGTVANDALAPNAWGLRHALGNVLEWTADTWIDDVSRLPPTTAPCLFGRRMERVARGGAWNLEETASTLIYRTPLQADHRYNHTGFRVLRELRLC